MKKTTLHSLFAAAFCTLLHQPVSAETQAAAKQKMPWENAAYEKTIPATMATPRPEEGVEEGWTEWMKHHNNRCDWVAEKEVDLLMIGDSIVFGWGRLGKPVWDEFYGERKAVEIGSSGDQTKHMLWHLQNGGLAGMKDRNPKVVLVMIGTNNRGIPELHGYDTAYGVLAILKEIHAQLPKSKILLMPIFPRGNTPEDAGRLRNEEINEILKTYVDNETVHWLDIGHVFLNGDGTIKKELMPDSLHPNIPGYHAWAEAMELTIRKMLGE
jgi:lysophospholipase L1-like esterase